MVLANYAYLFLPLTIWYVLLCTLPFMLAIISYFAYGEKMGLASVFAAILSFVAIVVLALANPASDNEAENMNYVLGVILCLISVLAICLVVLTTRQMQDIDSFLIMKSYNLISAALIGLYILVRWPITG